MSSAAFLIYMAAKPHTNGIVRLSRQEIVDCLEAESRRRCGLSARQLLKRANTGRLKDRGAVADLLSLSRLLRRNDPILAR